MYTCKVHAYEGFYEDLARQNIVARLFQRQLGFRLRHTWVSGWSLMGSSHRRSVLGHYLGCCTVCSGTSAHRPCFDLSAYHLSVHHFLSI
jgi:hypothetical protein